MKTEYKFKSVEDITVLLNAISQAEGQVYHSLGYFGKSGLIGSPLHKELEAIQERLTLIRSSIEPSFTLKLDVAVDSSDTSLANNSGN